MKRIGFHAVLLAIALLGGCLGADEPPLIDDGSDGEPGAGDAPPSNEDEGTSDETGDDAEPTVEDEVYTYQGTGLLGWGGGMQWWPWSDGCCPDITTPETFLDGTVELTWESELSTGHLVLWVYDETDELIGEFDVHESPFIAELLPDDPRVHGGQRMIVVADEGDPITIHHDIEWVVTFTFQVPTS